MAPKFGSEAYLNEMFNFVTDEDRTRWATPTPEERKALLAGVGESVGNIGSELSQEARQAARFQQGQLDRPTKRTRIITERIHEEEDLDEFTY